MGGRVLQGAVQTCPGAASQAKIAPPRNPTPPPRLPPKGFVTSAVPLCIG